MWDVYAKKHTSSKSRFPVSQKVIYKSYICKTLPNQKVY